MRFKLLAGGHTEAAGEHYTVQDGVFESEKDLVAIFGRTKFERVEDGTALGAKAAKLAGGGREEAKAARPSAFGDEVSDQFPKAGEAGLKVLKKGTKYTVVDADDPAKPLNEEALTSKDKVNEFIGSFLQG